MQLKALMTDIEVQAMSGDDTIAIRDVVCDSKKAGPGSCFVAMRGGAHDGHTFIAEAIVRGAAVIVSERPLSLPHPMTTLLVRDARRAFGIMAASMAHEPSRQFTLIGVTGTNGKTTTTFLLESIFAEAGLTPGVIGTITHRFAGHLESALHTTPTADELQRLFSAMRERGVTACAMEVSSHALDQGRVIGSHFDGAIFTNLTPEHLDYHPDVESYFAAKARLFHEVLEESQKGRRFAVINIDDPYGKRLAASCRLALCRYSLTTTAEVTARSVDMTPEGLSLHVETPVGAIRIRSRLIGRFNAANILAAAGAAVMMGVDREVIGAGIAKLLCVPGRFEQIPNARGVTAVVDYAHTPDALTQVLQAARHLTRGRLIVVFGCGGDRDRLKRPLMGEVAARLADVAILTSDNPRSENPHAIIAEIEQGVRPRLSPVTIVDRREAIQHAASMARSGDVIVVAGKGHEHYQVIGDARRPFEDRKELVEALCA